MKKIFLSLLALVGVAGGLVCTSCSGGGGKEQDGYAKAMAGVVLQLWPSATPSLTIAFEQPISSNVCAASYIPGSSTSYPGQFSIDHVEKVTAGDHAGTWMVRSNLNIQSSTITTDQQFKEILRVGDVTNVLLHECSVVLYFEEGSKGGSAELWAKGTYGDDNKGVIQNAFPGGATFIINGKMPDYSYFQPEKARK